MALKDLVADHRKIAEETIEKIVSVYVRYDSAAYKIIWTPHGNLLGNEAKVLVFLVAVLGWQYVLDENLDVPTKPANLESELGITGGTLRPILKKLKDSHLLTVVDGHYRVQIANFDSIQGTISDDAARGTRKGTTRKPTKIKQEENDGGKSDRSGETKKKSRGASRQLKTLLTKWARDGFFGKPKTLADLLERYHEYGVITKQTSLSGLLLDAVRQGLFSRTKVDIGGKQVWAYKTRNS